MVHTFFHFLFRPRPTGRKLAIAAICAFSGMAAAAQSPLPRIVAPVDDASRVTVEGSVPRRARPEFDRGPVSDSTPMKSMRVVLKHSPQQEAALQRFLHDLQDRSSPSFHKWLTPDQFAQLYGVANQDVAAIAAWLRSEGLTVAKIPKGRGSIEFSGSASQIEYAFRTSIHTFLRGDGEFLSNIAAPSIPSALAPVVGGVDLNTIRPHSYLVRGPKGQYDPSTGRFVPVPNSNQSAGSAPQFTGSLNGLPLLYFTPGDAATQYNTPNAVLNANFAGGATYDGTGVTIGIIGIPPLTDTSPVVNFGNQFLGKVPSLTVTTLGSPSAGGDYLVEAYLDIETSVGLAPGAAIHFYTSDDLFTAISQLLDDNTVDILSVSYGDCEPDTGNAMASYWQQAAAQGIAVTVAAGDSGSADCDAAGDGLAVDGLAVDGYASTPYDIAVGGTDTYALVGNFDTYVASANSASDFYRTLRKPIAESPWNDSQFPPGPIATATHFKYLGNDSQGVVGGGGGQSNCAIQTSSFTCLGGYPKPEWQSGLGVPADGVRDLPDVSLLAGNAVDQATWAVCTYDTDCTLQSNGSFYISGEGGTSASAPAFAGMLALVEQKTGGRLGQAANELYSLFNGPHSAEIFNDIAIGNNSMPCLEGSPDCVKNTAGNYFLSGFNAGAGYDLASGLGTVNATNLVAYWMPTPAIKITPASTTAATGFPLQVTVTVSGVSGTPTGNVTLSGGGFASALTGLSAGSAVFTIPADTLAVGSDTLTANYAGDSTYGPGTWSTQIAVTALPATNMALTPASHAVKQSSSLSVAIAVTSAYGTPTGKVTLSCGSYTSAPTALKNGAATIVIPANALALGVDTVTAAYSGSAAFEPSSNQFIVGVVGATKLEPYVQVSAAQSIWAGAPLGVSIDVQGFPIQPTGSVYVSAGSYQSAVVTLVDGKASFTVPANSLPAGQYEKVKAFYSGDTFFARSNGDAYVLITQLTPTVKVSPASAGVLRATALSVQIAVSDPSAKPTGTVKLSSGSYASAATTLSAGMAQIVVPASTLAAGADTLTATYSGNPDFTSATGTVPVTVTLQTPTVVVTPAATKLKNSSSLQVTVKVSAAHGTPSGTIRLSGGDYTSGLIALVDGSATVDIPAYGLAIGSDTLTASYSGDANNMPATGNSTVTVTGKEQTPVVTVTPAETSVPRASSLSVTVTIVASPHTPAGTVILSGGGYTSTATILAGGKTIIVIPAGTLDAGTDTLTASYSGDADDLAETGSAMIAVTKLKPTVSITPAAASWPRAESLVITVSVAASAGTPTGTVTLSTGKYTSTATALIDGSAKITVPADTLALGSNILSASYSGDANDRAATGTSAVTVNRLAPAVSFEPPYTATSGEPFKATIEVTAAGGVPTGTITLSAQTSAGTVFFTTSAPVPLDNGTVSIQVSPGPPAGSSKILLTATYSGDANDKPAEATQPYKVTAN